MILVLDNAPYHHGYDKKVENPTTNSKVYNTGLLREFKIKKLDAASKRYAVPRTGEYLESAPTGPNAYDVATGLRRYFVK